MLWRKIDAKIGRKSLEEKMEELDNSLSVQYRFSAYPRLVGKLRLSAKKTHEDSKRRA